MSPLTTLDGLWGGNNKTAQRIRFENNRWYTVRVRVTADRVRGWIDDEEILDLSTMGRRLTLDRLELRSVGALCLARQGGDPLDTHPAVEGGRSQGP